MLSSDILQEYADNAGIALQVDRPAGVIRGVKLLGRISKKGREYPPAVMAKALPLYEGMRVNVDHVEPGARRSLRDRIGLVKGVTLKEDGLYGDFHYNPKHPLAEQIAWDAENAPQNLGFSHDTRGPTRNAGGKVVVESIDKVLSVDLVANPATTSGLFESEDEDLQEGWGPIQRAAAIAKRRELAMQNIPIDLPLPHRPIQDPVARHLHAEQMRLEKAAADKAKIAAMADKAVELHRDSWTGGDEAAARIHARKAKVLHEFAMESHDSTAKAYHRAGMDDLAKQHERARDAHKQQFEMIRDAESKVATESEDEEDEGAMSQESLSDAALLAAQLGKKARVASHKAYSAGGTCDDHAAAYNANTLAAGVYSTMARELEEEAGKETDTDAADKIRQAAKSRFTQSVAHTNAARAHHLLAKINSQSQTQEDDTMFDSHDVLQEAWSDAARAAALASRKAHAMTKEGDTSGSNAMDADGNHIGSWPAGAHNLIDNEKAHKAAAKAHYAAAKEAPDDATKAAHRASAVAHMKSAKAERGGQRTDAAAAVAHHAAADAWRKAGDKQMAAQHEEAAKNYDNRAGEDSGEAQESLDDLDGLSSPLMEELIALRKEKQNREIRESIDRELEAAGLDRRDPVVCSQVFMEGLEEASDPEFRQAKIRDRAEVIAASTSWPSKRPFSSSPLMEDTTGQPIPPAHAPLAERLKRFYLPGTRIERPGRAASSRLQEDITAIPPASAPLTHRLKRFLR